MENTLEDSLIYIYCILKSQPQINNQLTGYGVQLLVCGGYYVVTKLVSPDEFSEDNLKKNFSDLVWVEGKAREHIEVITTLMKNNTVIPFKFGTIFNSKENLEIFVNDYSSSLAENFNIIEGKEEWSVKIYCNKSKLYEQIPELSEEVKALEKQILESSPGKAFLLKRKRVELVEQEVKSILKTNGQKCYDGFKAISCDVCINNLLPHDLTGREDDMILNATFFVGKQRVSDFIPTAHLLQEKYRDIGFSFDVTGPWPPFSFISIKEHACTDIRQE
jgi:hypothetical protein